MSGLTHEQIIHSYECDVVRMVLQAKRLFSIEIKNPRDILKEYNITKEEIYFWFYQFYTEQVPFYKPVIEGLVSQE
jgi:hypothetical protein